MNVNKLQIKHVWLVYKLELTGMASDWSSDDSTGIPVCWLELELNLDRKSGDLNSTTDVADRFPKCSFNMTHAKRYFHW